MTVLKLIQEKKPLIHHITNWVTIFDCAQITRNIGALPVMAHAKEEVEEMTGIASALVLNIGTLTKELIESMILAGKAANKKGIPVVLDAVGCGATKLRTESTILILKQVKVDIIKGNAGEIATIAGADAEVRGVESIAHQGDIKEVIKTVSQNHNNAVVVVTGKTDYIGQGKEVKTCERGHEMMGKVVGTGCMAASILGAFASVSEDYFTSSIEAMNYYGECGEKAAEKEKEPVAFKAAFMDQIAKKIFVVA
ncbi:MAG: hydroxyethylthiazole kinase [Candidatus Margulisbacteria bacterium]|nr:hydroxyethylthiazole kinase [Candidatus Margulisiibacteriota bacterium]